MKKVVINICYGGFGLSALGLRRYAELKGLDLYAFQRAAGRWDGPYSMVAVTDDNIEALDTFSTSFATEPLDEEGKIPDGAYLSSYDIARDDLALVQTVEELGPKSWGDCARLKIVEIPDDVDWHISEYDGLEHIAEDHRTWS